MEARCVLPPSWDPVTRAPSGARRLRQSLAERESVRRTPVDRLALAGLKRQSGTLFLASSPHEPLRRRVGGSGPPAGPDVLAAWMRRRQAAGNGPTRAHAERPDERHRRQPPRLLQPTRHAPNQRVVAIDQCRDGGRDLRHEFRLPELLAFRTRSSSRQATRRTAVPSLRRNGGWTPRGKVRSAQSSRRRGLRWLGAGRRDAPGACGSVRWCWATPGLGAGDRGQAQGASGRPRRHHGGRRRKSSTTPDWEARTSSTTVGRAAG